MSDTTPPANSINTAGSLAAFTTPPPAIMRGRRFIRAVGSFIFFRVLLKLRVEDAHYVPASGPTIILINHISLLDPIPGVGALTSRDIVPICKEELYRHWFTRWIIDNWGIIHIRRGEIDMDALRQSLAVLKGKDALLVAPEGTRHKEGMTEPKDGVAWLAQKSGAVIVPCGLTGTGGFGKRWKRLQRAPVTVRYGRPVRLKPGLKRADYPKIMQELMYQIAPLVREDLRGDYADPSKATMETIEYV
jgi:1-acyl-sn-glycerol-3-phosphate acyltransferase